MEEEKRKKLKREEKWVGKSWVGGVKRETEMEMEMESTTSKANSRGGMGHRWVR